MAETLSLTITTARDELALIAEEVEALAEREDWPFDLVFTVNLVLEELALNVIEHGFDDDDDSKECKIELTSDADAVAVVVSDRGKPFDPLTEVPDADVDSAMDERQVGGLGVHLVETLMDEASYQRTDGMNRLTLVKFRSDPSQDSP